MIIITKNYKSYRVKSTTEYKLDVQVAITTHEEESSNCWKEKLIYVPLAEIIEIKDFVEEIN